MSTEYAEHQSPDLQFSNDHSLSDVEQDDIEVENLNNKALTEREIQKIYTTIFDLDARTAKNSSLADQSRTDDTETSDSVRLYRIDIGVFDTLNQAEEVTLTRGLKRAKMQLQVLCPDQPEDAGVIDGHSNEVELYRDVKSEIVPNLSGIEPKTNEQDHVRTLQEVISLTKDRLIKHNLRLSFSIAAKFQNRGLPLIDLIQEANLGLQDGIEKFNPELGYRLSTYASIRIERRILRELAKKSTIIRLPEEQSQGVGKITAVENMLRATFGHDPTPEEIAQVLDISPDAVEVAQANRRIAIVSSIDKPINGEADSDEFGTLIPDSGQNLEDDVEARMFSLDTAEALKMLPEKQRKVIEMRFGIGYNSGHTFQQIADEFDISVMRARQIEKKARATLGKDENFKSLLSYLE